MPLTHEQDLMLAKKIRQAVFEKILQHTASFNQRFDHRLVETSILDINKLLTKYFALALYNGKQQENKSIDQIGGTICLDLSHFCDDEQRRQLEAISIQLEQMPVLRNQPIMLNFEQKVFQLYGFAGRNADELESIVANDEDAHNPAKNSLSAGHPNPQTVSELIDQALALHAELNSSYERRRHANLRNAMQALLGLANSSHDYDELLAQHGMLGPKNCIALHFLGQSDFEPLYAKICR